LNSALTLNYSTVTVTCIYT